MGRQVTVYTTPTCDYCRQLKRFLSANGVEYKEVDLSTDHAAAEDVVRRTNQYAVPVVDIDGTLVVGFDGPQLRTLLRIDNTQ